MLEHNNTIYLLNKKRGVVFPMGKMQENLPVCMPLNAGLIEYISLENTFQVRWQGAYEIQ